MKAVCGRLYSLKRAKNCPHRSAGKSSQAELSIALRKGYAHSARLSSHRRQDKETQEQAFVTGNSYRQKKARSRRVKSLHGIIHMHSRTLLRGESSSEAEDFNGLLRRIAIASPLHQRSQHRQRLFR